MLSKVYFSDLQWCSMVSHELGYHHNKIVCNTDLSSFGNLDEGQEFGHLQKRFFLSAAAIFV